MIRYRINPKKILQRQSKLLINSFELNDLKESNYAKHISNKTNQYLESRYVRSRTSYFNKVKYTKKNFFRKLFDQVKNNVKKTWNVINSVLGRKKGKQLFKLNVHVEEVNGEGKIANEFNTYFANVANNLVSNIPNSDRRKNTGSICVNEIRIVCF